MRIVSCSITFTPGAYDPGLHKMLHWKYNADIKISPGSANYNNIFLVIFAGMALKLEKLAQLFQVSIHVLPCHPCNRLCSDYLSRLRIEIDTNKNYFLSTRHSSSNSKRVKIKLNIQLQVMLPGETPGETSAK